MRKSRNFGFKSWMLLVSSVITLLLSITLTHTAYAANLSCAAPVRIMPLGDSITQGKSSGVDINELQIGYRKTLYEMLLAAHHNVDFVGSQVHGQNYTGFDADHEGHPSQNTTFIRSNVEDFLTANPADIVLLHIGTNGRVDDDPASIEIILNRIDIWEASNNPVTVVLALIINRNSFHQITADFNDNVATMAAQRIANGDDIIVVDMEDGAGIDYALTTAGGDMWDNVHPFATGYDKMAQVWYDALKTVLPTCIISTPVTTGHMSQPYTYDVNASGDPTFSLTEAPPNMSIDSITGVISWTPPAPGDYAVTVNVANSVGSDSQAFVIHVPDTTPPVITLVGEPIVIVELGSTYVDAGATAVDNVDGDLTNAIVTTSDVNVNEIGTYTVTYKVSDSSSNAAQPVTRTVHVFAEMHALSYQTLEGIFVDLFWTPVDGAQWYNIVLLDDAANLLFNTWEEAAEICTGINCAFTPGSDLLPIGLLNSQYQWFVQSWGNDEFSSWRDGNFTIEVDPPQPSDVNVNPNQGRPTITWGDDTNALYFQVFIGDENGGIVYFEWHQRAAELCNGTICTLKPDINPLAGDYQVFVQPWGPGGFVPNNAQGWLGPANFTLGSTPPQAVTGLTATSAANGQVTFSWKGSTGATWYHLWTGTVDPVETYYTGWHLAADIGCENAEICAFMPDESFSPGSYGWYVQAWGPGGISTGGATEGWAEGPEFSP